MLVSKGAKRRRVVSDDEDESDTAETTVSKEESDGTMPPSSKCARETPIKTEFVHPINTTTHIKSEKNDDDDDADLFGLESTIQQQQQQQQQQPPPPIVVVAPNPATVGEVHGYLDHQQKKQSKVLRDKYITGGGSGFDSSDDDEANDDGGVTDSGESEEGFSETYPEEALAHKKEKERRATDTREDIEEESEESDSDAPNEYDENDSMIAPDSEVEKEQEEAKRLKDEEASDCSSAIEGEENDSEEDDSEDEEEDDENKLQNTRIELPIATAAAGRVLNSATESMRTIYYHKFIKWFEEPSHSQVLVFFIQAYLIETDVIITQELRQRFEAAKQIIAQLLVLLTAGACKTISDVADCSELSKYLTAEPVNVISDGNGGGAGSGVPEIYLLGRQKCCESTKLLPANTPRAVFVFETKGIKVFHPIIGNLILCLRKFMNPVSIIQKEVDVLIQTCPLGSKRNFEWIEAVAQKSNKNNLLFRNCGKALLEFVMNTFDTAKKSLTVYSVCMFRALSNDSDYD